MSDKKVVEMLEGLCDGPVVCELELDDLDADISEEVDVGALVSESQPTLPDFIGGEGVEPAGEALVPCRECFNIIKKLSHYFL